MGRRYTESDKMCDIIRDEFRLLNMLARFGLHLGFGDKTVGEVCREHNVDTRTLLAVANFIKHGADDMAFYIDNISVPTLVDYLKRSHNFFLDYQLPTIRRKLLSALDCSPANEVSFLIMRYYDKYTAEVKKHMEMENKRVFTYVAQLLEGKRPAGYEIELFARSHGGMQDRLEELKEIIIKYHTAPTDADVLSGVLFDIFNCAEDLRNHCEVEDKLFVPAVRRLEERLAVETASETETDKTGKNPDILSEREQDIVKCVVLGMTNKEIAGKLFISLNTVLTHRKNISRKLSIHSVAGLTIYAIVNHLVNLDEIDIS